MYKIIDKNHVKCTECKHISKIPKFGPVYCEKCKTHFYHIDYDYHIVVNKDIYINAHYDHNAEYCYETIKSCDSKKILEYHFNKKIKEYEKLLQQLENDELIIITE